MGIPVLVPENIITGPFNRTLGPVGSRELLGAGFMHKPDKRRDHLDYAPRFYSLCYLISGSGEYHLGNRIWKLSPGDYFQRIPGQVHSTYIEPDGSWWECFLDFGPQLTAALAGMRVIDPGRPVGHAGLSRELINDFAGVLQSLRSSPEHELPLLLPRMLELHSRVLSRGSGTETDEKSAMIRRACRLLSENLDARIDLRAFCERRGWGYELFRKEFTAAVGVPPGHYRIRRRMDAARHLLRAEPNLQISAIADRLGYVSVYEFSAQFKKHLGMSPRAYRQR